jgi:hypothetical protein
MHFNKPQTIEIPGGTVFTNQTMALFREGEDSFGNILELAEHFGWEDTHGDASTGWEPEDADNCEADALFYLQSLGVWVFAQNENGDLVQRV